MRDKPYYSVRTGKHPTGGRWDLWDLKRLFLAAYRNLRDTGYFQKVLGTECVDGFDPGEAGSDVESFFYLKLKRQLLWPILERYEHYDEDELFDVIELLHDCAAKGTDGSYHSYSDCGTHYKEFDDEAGRAHYRQLMNELLANYGEGYQLTTNGEVVTLAPRGLRELEQAPRPPGDPQGVSAKVDAAIGKFRRRGSSWEDRRDAIRDLADVLEFLRPEAKQVLTSKDEADLFNIANNFGIRHHNQTQKTHYDQGIWLSWMFYFYLATIHAATRLIDKAKQPRRSDI